AKTGRRMNKSVKDFIANQLFGGLGVSDGLGESSLLIFTFTPLRNLKIPDDATESPAFKPDSTLIKSPCVRPVRINFCCATKLVEAVFVIPACAAVRITKTESPNGARKMDVAG